MTGTLSSQSVLVTGASAGIGKATVAALVAAGASVVARRRSERESFAPLTPQEVADAVV